MMLLVLHTALMWYVVSGWVIEIIRSLLRVLLSVYRQGRWWYAILTNAGIGRGGHPFISWFITKKVKNYLLYYKIFDDFLITLRNLCIVFILSKIMFRIRR